MKKLISNHLSAIWRAVGKRDGSEISRLLQTINKNFLPKCCTGKYNSLEAVCWWKPWTFNWRKVSQKIRRMSGIISPFVLKWISTKDTDRVFIFVRPKNNFSLFFLAFYFEDTSLGNFLSEKSSAKDEVDKGRCFSYMRIPGVSTIIFNSILRGVAKK